MAKDADMRKLMGQLLPCLYSRVVPNNANIVTPDLFVPFGCLTEDFFEKIYVVLAAKMPSIGQRWENFVAINRFKMASSYEVYLEYAMFACIAEIGFSDNVFDNLLNACGLLIAFSIEALEKTKVIFCDLTVDIFMVFYKNALKDRFCKSGGFEKFTGYLHHTYLKWANFIQTDPDDSIMSSTDSGCLVKRWNNILQKELEKDVGHLDFIDYNDIRNSVCHSLAKEVLAIIKVKLPPLASSEYIYTDRKLKMLTLEESKRRIVASSKFKATASVSVTEVLASTLASKRKNSEAISKSKSPAVASILEPTVGASLPESSIAASIPKSTVTAWKPESTMVASIPESTTSTSEYECTAAASLPESTPTTFVPESTISTSKHESTASASIPKSTVTAWKPESTIISSIPELTASISKHESTAAASIPKSTIVASMPESTGSTSKHESTAAASILKSPVAAFKPKSTIADSIPELTASVLQQFLNTVTDSQASTENEKISWCDNIVKAVINYNSKNSSRVNTNKRIQKVDDILRHLKGTIKSLIGALEDCDKN